MPATFVCDGCGMLVMPDTVVPITAGEATFYFCSESGYCTSALDRGADLGGLDGTPFVRAVADAVRAELRRRASDARFQQWAAARGGVR